MVLLRLPDCHLFVLALRLTLAALIVLSWIAAGPAAAQGPIITVPFQGTSFAVATDFTITPEELRLSGTGHGHATQLGAFTLSGTKRIDLRNNTFTAEVTATAANGDQLFVQSVGVLDPPALTHGTGMFTITGGTGRFADAAGSGTLEKFVAADFTVTDVFDGSISREASNRP
jgi:hypothetical protein